MLLRSGICSEVGFQSLRWTDFGLCFWTLFHYLDKLPLGFVLGFGYVFGVFLGSVFPFGFVLVLNSLFWLLLLCFCLVLTLIGLDIF